LPGCIVHAERIFVKDRFGYMGQHSAERRVDRNALARHQRARQRFKDEAVLPVKRIGAHQPVAAIKSRHLLRE
jgi:hypothetical protein